MSAYIPGPDEFNMSGFSEIKDFLTTKYRSVVEGSQNLYNSAKDSVCTRVGNLKSSIVDNKYVYWGGRIYDHFYDKPLKNMVENKKEFLSLLATNLISGYLGCAIGTTFKSFSRPTLGNIVVSTLGTLTTMAINSPMFYSRKEKVIIEEGFAECKGEAQPSRARTVVTPVYPKMYENRRKIIITTV